MKSLWRIALSMFCFLNILPSAVNASHLMGGNLTYTYNGLNSSSGQYEYTVTLKIYRYCAAGSSQLPTSVGLGIYQDNAANPTGNKNIVGTTTLPLIAQQSIVPPNANASCTFTPSVCVEEGTYQTVISVPLNTTGYYLIADRCCRNGNIANLDNPGGAGQAYFAYMPPANIVNNSATFAVPPVPFICTGDTVSLLNQANDIDGDSLVYSFVTPYNGISNSNNPNPGSPASYTWPIPTITWALTGGFSLTSPFGTGGYSAIDSSTGLTTYLSPNQGFYVVAVEIKEYRNGVLIGITRRDIQLIFIACPVNPAPTLNNLQTTYTIQEGQTLCFNAAYTDPNGDSIFITHTGDIFNSAITNPAATFTDASGSASASSQFCWTTSCNQGRTNPYQFSVSATDNGCPAKTTNTVYTINVQNTLKPAAMTGPDTLCYNAATGVAYSVSATSGYTYNWIITNGTQASGTHTSSIGVNFTTSGLATISVVAVNPYGCPSDTLTKQVYIKILPTAVAGADVQFCSGGTANLGTTSTSGYTYSWSPATGLSSTTISNPTVTVTNSGTTQVATNYILTTTANGCSNKDTVVVTVNPYPVANAGNNASICSGNSVPLGSLPTSGYTYSWSPATGLSNSGVSNPVFSLTNGTIIPDTLSYIVVAQNSFGCNSSDTVQVIVRPVPTAVAGTDQVFCSGGTGTIGTAATTGYTYSWSPSTGLTSGTASTTTVTLTNGTTVNDTIPYIVTTGFFGCTAKDTVLVVVKALPVSNAGNNVSLCSGNTAQLGTTNTTGYTYSWSPSTGLSNTTISNPTVTLTNATNNPIAGTYVVTTTLAGCVTTDTVLVTSNPVPVVTAGADQTYCSGQTVNIGGASTSGYTYSWSPGTGLSSSTVSNPQVNATNTGASPLVINYTVIATWFGCHDTDAVAITVKPTPVSVAGNNALLCSGNTVQLGGLPTSGYTYSWSPINGLSNTVISNPSLTLTNLTNTTDTLTYVVTTTLNGCVSSDSVQVISSPVPTANAGSDVIFCSGQNASIGASAVSGYIYNWSPASGLSSTNTSTSTVTLTNGTAAVDTVPYILSVNWFGCIAKDTVIAYVKPLPVSHAGVNTTLCSGDTLTIGTSATSGYTYSWSPSAGLNNSTISNPLATVNYSGSGTTTVTYNVTTTLNGCSTSDSVKITVNPLPVVQGTANPSAICAGTSATLNASGASTYNWALLTSPGNSIGTGNSISVSPAVSTSYILTGTSAATCINKDTVFLQVNQLPIVVATAASDTICQGDTVQIQASGATNYTWNVLGNPTAFSTSNPININPSGTTTYILSGTDNNLCSNRDTFQIYVNPAASVNGITGTLSLCPGVQGVSYWVNNPNPNSTYGWTVLNGTLSSGQGNDTAFVNWPNPGPGNVTVIETTNHGCKSIPVVLPVNVNTILTPAAPTGNLTLCANQASGQSYSTLSTPGSTYNWLAIGGNIVSGNGTNAVTVNWNVQGPATVSLWYEETSVTVDTVCFGVSDTLHVTINPVPVTSAIQGTGTICVFDSSIYNVTATPGSTYNWTVNGGTIISGNGSNSIHVAWNANGTNTVTVQETNSFSCTGNPVTTNITVNALPIVNAGSDATVCFGTSTNLSASANGGINYTWSPAAGLDNPTIANPIATPNATTTYTVYVVDVNGCHNTDQVIVFVNALPLVSAGNAAAICLGKSTTLNGTGAVNYQWSPATGLNDPSLASPTASPTSTTTYTVVGTDANSCSNTSSVTVTVNPLPVANAGTDVLICDGSSTTLSASASGSTSYQYQWSPTTGLNNANISNPVANPTSTTTYTVTVTDNNGCTGEDQVDISINAQPVAAFAVDTTLTKAGCDGVSITLINTSTNALNYNWTLGDGATSTDPAPSHTYVFGQNFTITLIAINNLCADTLAIQNPIGTLDAFIKNRPNVFSPNGDGINDCFDLGKNTDFEACSSWLVFNRWGEKVFESDANHKCWNGKKDSNGEDLPEGTYFYVLKIKGSTFKGALELMR